MCCCLSARPSVFLHVLTPACCAVRGRRKCPSIFLHTLTPCLSARPSVFLHVLTPAVLCCACPQKEAKSSLDVNKAVNRHMEEQKKGSGKAGHEGSDKVFSIFPQKNKQKYFFQKKNKNTGQDRSVLVHDRFRSAACAHFDAGFFDVFVF